MIVKFFHLYLIKDTNEKIDLYEINFENKENKENKDFTLFYKRKSSDVIEKVGYEIKEVFKNNFFNFDNEFIDDKDKKISMRKIKKKIILEIKKKNR